MEILNKYIYNPQTDLLGKGGFSTVYKAFDKILEIPVALKFFHPQDQANKYTIINEIKRAIILSHPNIVRYYGIETLVNRNFHGEEEDVQIGIMEYVEEGQLKTFINQNPLSKKEIAKLLIDTLEGLKYLHNQGIIHRDIKPQNILLGRDKQNRLIAKIADFGISKNVDSNQVSASMLLGTVEYMAPEQFNPHKFGVDKKIGYNVDIWAFGVTAYYLLTSEMLFGSRSGDTSAAQLINKIVNVDKVQDALQGIDEPFHQVLSRCIIPDANERTDDIDELIALLKNFNYDDNSPVTSKQAQVKPQFQPSNTSANEETMDLSYLNEKKDDIPQTEVTNKNVKPSNDYASSRPHEKQNNLPHNTGENDDQATVALNYSADAAVIPEEESEIIPSQTKKSKKPILIGLGVVMIAAAVVFFMKFSAAPTEQIKSGIQISAPDQPRSFALLEIEKNLVLITGGAFTMGRNSTTEGSTPIETPAHEVSVGNFKLLNHEITQKLWNDIMGDGKFSDTANAALPAINVSWTETQEFISKLNKLSGKKYRLPTEAEWEYACTKAGIDDYDLNEISWNTNNSAGVIHPVKTKKADGLGLYDMLGNAYEWCDDWFSLYLKTSEKEGKVLRGGDFKNSIGLLHSKVRNLEAPGKGNSNIGFRLAIGN